MTLGFMLVNRLISVVDATISSRRVNASERMKSSSFFIEPNMNSLMVGYKYEF